MRHRGSSAIPSSIVNEKEDSLSRIKASRMNLSLKWDVVSRWITYFLFALLVYASVAQHIRHKCIMTLFASLIILRYVDHCRMVNLGKRIDSLERELRDK